MVDNPNRIDAVGVLLGHEQVVSAVCLALFALACWRLRLRISSTDVGRLVLAVVVVTLVFYRQPYDLVAVGGAAACTDWSDFGGLVLVLAAAGVVTLAPVAQQIADVFDVAAVPFWRLMVKLTAIALLAAGVFTERQGLSAALAGKLPTSRRRNTAAGFRRV